MKINKNEITKEMILEAMKCKNADELISLAKTYDYDLTREEAEAFLSEMRDRELDAEQLDKVAGGVCWSNCPNVEICFCDGVIM